METFLGTLLHTGSSALYITLSQLVNILGAFFVIGYLLSKLNHHIQSNYYKLGGWHAILFTAWIGTPLHELGHALMCILFHHKIESMSLFKPNRETGGLGYVNHSFNPHSLYQKVGNFFIGAAPLIVGTTFLTLAARYLLHNGRAVMGILSHSSDGPAMLLVPAEAVVNIFGGAQLTDPLFWIFILLSISITAHIAPSKKDLLGMYSGLIWIAFILLLINTAFVVLKSAPALDALFEGIQAVTMIGLFALTLSIMHVIVTQILVYVFKRKHVR